MCDETRVGVEIPSATYEMSGREGRDEGGDEESVGFAKGDHSGFFERVEMLECERSVGGEKRRKEMMMRRYGDGQ